MAKPTLAKRQMEAAKATIEELRSMAELASGARSYKDAAMYTDMANGATKVLLAMERVK